MKKYYRTTCVLILLIMLAVSVTSSPLSSSSSSSSSSTSTSSSIYYFRISSSSSTSSAVSSSSSSYQSSSSSLAKWGLTYDGVRRKGLNFAGHLLCLLSHSSVLLVFYISLGGIKYIMSDDPGEHMEAKKMVINSIVGALCIYTLIAAAGNFGMFVDPECRII